MRHRHLLCILLFFLTAAALPAPPAILGADPQQATAAEVPDTGAGDRTGRPCSRMRPDNPPAGDKADLPDPQIRELKRCYRHDPTGVRARLGMCRRAQGGPGGHGGRHHGPPGTCPQEP